MAKLDARQLDLFINTYPAVDVHELVGTRGLFACLSGEDFATQQPRGNLWHRRMNDWINSRKEK